MVDTRRLAGHRGLPLREGAGLGRDGLGRALETGE